MSRTANMVEVTPPSHSFVVTESVIIRGYVCPNCNGCREFNEQTGHDTVKTKQCSYCAGTGKVKATVGIVWSPDEK